MPFDRVEVAASLGYPGRGEAEGGASGPEAVQRQRNHREQRRRGRDQGSRSSRGQVGDLPGPDGPPTDSGVPDEQGGQGQALEDEAGVDDVEDPFGEEGLSAAWAATRPGSR